MTAKDLLNRLEELVKDKPCQDMEAGRQALLRLYAWLLFQVKHITKEEPNSRPWYMGVYRIYVAMNITALSAFLSELAYHEQPLIRGMARVVLNDSELLDADDPKVDYVDLTRGILIVSKLGLVRPVAQQLRKDLNFQRGLHLWRAAGMPIFLPEEPDPEEGDDYKWVNKN